MTSTFLKTSIHPFCSASCNFSKSFLVIATSSLFSVMFKVIWATCIGAVDCFFEKFSQKEVGWCKVCGWWWPKGMPDNVITGEVLQVSCCGFSLWVAAASCWKKQSCLFSSGKAVNWVKRFWKLFAVSLPCKKLGPQLDFETLCSKYQSLTGGKNFYVMLLSFWLSILCCFDY